MTTQFLQNHQYKAEIQLAMTVVVVYDHLTTIGREVEYVWKKEWSLVQMLFMVSRYLGDAVYIFTAIETVGLSPGIQNKTYQWLFFQNLGMVVIILSMQGILQHRISAMYCHSRKIIFLMLSFFLCEIISMIILSGIILSKVYVKKEVIPGVATIEVGIYPYPKYSDWIAPTIMEVLLLVLALYAGFRHIGTTYKLETTNLVRPSLAFILIRDSILFPFLAFIAYASTAIAWRFFPLAFAGGQILASASGVLACVLGPRLMLNLRETYYLSFTDEYDQAVRDILYPDLVQLDDALENVDVPVSYAVTDNDV